MKTKKIAKLIKHAKKIENSSVHIGIQVVNGKVSLTFLDSMTLDIIQEGLHNKSYKEAKKILKAYKTLLENDTVLPLDSF